MTRLVLMLDDGQVSALEHLAKKEYRTTWQQAALIIRQELERRGLLAIGTSADSKNESAVFDSLADKQPKTAKVTR